LQQVIDWQIIPNLKEDKMFQGLYAGAQSLIGKWESS